MENREFSLASGAKLLVGMAPFIDAKRLHDRVLQALVGKGVGGLDLKSMHDTSSVGTAMLDALMNIASNTEVESAVFECAKRSTYSHNGSDGARVVVDRTLFDDPVAGEKARGDFYMICAKIMEVNLLPFLQAIISSLKGRPEMIASIQALTSKPTK